MSMTKEHEIQWGNPQSMSIFFQVSQSAYKRISHYVVSLFLLAEVL